MVKNFSPKDPYEVQGAWDTIMNAVDQIRAEQKWPDEYIAKTLKRIAESLEESENNNFEDNPKLDFFA